MFLNANQITTLQNIVRDSNKARYDAARMQAILRTMLPRDVLSSGKISIDGDNVTIKAYGKTQKVNLKIAT